MVIAALCAEGMTLIEDAHFIDVYKRQDEIFSKGICILSQNSWIIASVSVPICMAVSYTHLAVYKRQETIQTDLEEIVSCTYTLPHLTLGTSDASAAANTVFDDLSQTVISLSLIHI